MTRKKKKTKCPRCNSTRLQQRLSGHNYCERCGQRWTAEGVIVPSFDRRKLQGTEPKEQQMTMLT